MLRRDILKTLGSLSLLGVTPLLGKSENAITLYFACSEKNDLYRVAVSSGISCFRYSSTTEALKRVPDKSVLLILADGYPHTATQMDLAVLRQAVQKDVRLYIEFPSSLPGKDVGSPRLVALGHYGNVLQRVVVTSDLFAPEIEPMRILSLHECYFTPIAAQKPELVLARVTGFDRAIYGLPQEGVDPILFEEADHGMLVATTKLSSFIQSRYSPPEAWATMWNKILSRLSDGRSIALRKWTPAVHPAFQRDSVLLKEAEVTALRKGIAWYKNARLFVAPQWKHLVDRYSQEGQQASLGPQASWPSGNGSDGVLEGFSSTIRWDGKQPMGWKLRADCAGETAMTMALSGTIAGSASDSSIATNLNNFIYFNSKLAQGPRNDPHSPSFGLIGWATPSSLNRYYGDDNARSMLGTMAASALLRSDRWNEKVLRCLLANLRTTNTLGFRPNSLTDAELQKSGWRHFYDDATFVNYHPHFEAYPWACFLRAYEKTQYAPFLERARNGIRMTMEAYPARWRWTNGLQQERARMLLALAWLIRIDDTPEHRQWLKRVAIDLVSLQGSSGGIREELGAAGESAIPPPQTNEQYGTREEPLIQENGDPACDMLYTCNFAFLGLHEAAAATGDPVYRDAEDKLAEFFCRIQISSVSHPELSGGWYRAFNDQQWNFWASGADWGWGPWSIESGWTQAWICSVLALRHLHTSLWDLTGRNTLGADLKKLLPIMFS